MMEYRVEGSTFNFSYQQVREEHQRISELTDEAFLTELPAALHLAAFLCFVKEIPTYVCLRDDGIIHELIHLVHFPEETSRLPQIRELFDKQLALAP